MDQNPHGFEPIHASIEYSNPNGHSIESMVTITDPKLVENRKFLHSLLDEWIDRRVEGKHADHFVVYGKWPGEDPFAS